MAWELPESTELDGGVVRWTTFGEGLPDRPGPWDSYSSFLWRDIGPALARHGRKVYVFDLPGYGQSDKRDGQDSR